MRILLDTHVFLWYITGDPRLSQDVQSLIRATSNEVFMSVVSLWEIIVKHQLGKLPLPSPPAEYIPTQRQRHMIQSLLLDEASVSQLAKLPALHRDPFDRMLICQALSHDLVIATADAAIWAYPGVVTQNARV
jgi:PIN domain nuclease of toxin-antitoxin system